MIGQQTSEMRIPDQVGAVVGWRSWRLRNKRLYSYCNNTEWEPHKPLEVGLPPDNRGIHAFKDKEEAIDYSGVFGVAGEIYMWGHIVEHERGYRSAYAYPKSFILPPRGLTLGVTRREVIKLAELYGVEVIGKYHGWEKYSPRLFPNMFIISMLSFYVIFMSLLFSGVVK